LIAEVHLYPKEAWKQGQNPIKEIKYTFPVSPEVLEELGDNLPTVETCVLLSRRDINTVRIEVKQEDKVNIKLTYS